MNHGAESFAIEGEGVVDTSLGGRSGGEPDRVSDPTASAPRALAASAAPPFRFSRVGPKGTQLSEQTLEKLARAMIQGSGRTDTKMPAGFTYLGQFVDHDLTADVTGKGLGDDVSPAELLQGRSPRLDLDSLYGRGPLHESSERFYSDAHHLRVGRTIEPGGAGFDLPRVGKGKVAEARKADIPDLRNDENLAVAQTHAAFIRFHNRVVDRLPKSVPDHQRFRWARRRVVRHYQWMLRTDYLPRIVQPSIVRDVFTNGRKLVEPAADPMTVPRMPVEFSVAAFRMGHSMIRSDYDWNSIFDNGSGTLEQLFVFSATGGNLGFGRHLTNIWVADWRRLYDFGEAGRDDLTVPKAKFNHAMRIDTSLTVPLSQLPKGSFGGPSMPSADIRRNLAFRNLMRAKMLDLATGQQMVQKLQDRGVSVTPLTRTQILEGSNGAVLAELTTTERNRLAEHTPLWFYVLREAELNRGRMTGVGGRIIAETFHRAMEGSRSSIVRNPDWRPDLGPDSTTFRMVDLLLFAFEGRKKLLNPNG